MAKVKLSSKAKLEFEVNGKIENSFDVTYREPSRKQVKIMGKENKEILDLFTKNQTLTKRAAVFETKVDALKALDKPLDTLRATSKLEKIYDEQVILEDKYEALGGIDKLIEASKMTYDLAVGGKDKEALEKFIEEFSDYGTILEALKEDVKEQQGKH